MNKNVAITIAFGLGAAIGSVVTWKLVKTTYERIAQEEIDSVKETYSKTLEEALDEEPEQEIELDVDRARFANIINTYNGSSNDEEKGGSDTINIGTPPFIIKPDDYGDVDDYDIYSFTYYADGVLADEGDEPIENITDYVPEDFADYFGEFEDDAVHVRNHIRKADYEILRDERRYYEVVHSSLSPSDDE